ncbi:hypothetical protein [Kitasatospora sp. NPDC051914]|uniref:hypothetical protein n=1 Tax=Kitasatospora sp. NPDC051914 TaxID=3154945 RepID=UPI00342E514B
MTGAADEGPVLWALAVRETDEGGVVAEVIVEVDEGHYGALAVDAWESGFVAAAGQVPVTTGAVQVRGGRFERLVLVGGRQVWEPRPAVPAPPTWLSAAAEGGALVTVVLPRTWPEGLAGLPPERRADAFEESLEDARENGRVLQGVVAVEMT